MVRADKPAMRSTTAPRTFPKVALFIVIGLAMAVIGWAWIDGGREPLREIVEPVAVPEAAR